MKMVSRRVVIKISGEALSLGSSTPFSSTCIESVVAGIKLMYEAGFEIAIVIGGGNLLRGKDLEKYGMARAVADQAGMLATVINSLVLQEVFERYRLVSRVMSAIEIRDVCEMYIRRRALRHLSKGRVVIFAAGTGNPFFSTDSAASLRSVEIGAECLFKATKVDGIYDEDPFNKKNAVRYEHITYNEAIARNFQILDTTAIVMCRDYNVRIVVFNMQDPNAWLAVSKGVKVGSTIS